MRYPSIVVSYDIEGVLELPVPVYTIRAWIATPVSLVATNKLFKLLKNECSDLTYQRQATRPTLLRLERKSTWSW